MSLYLDGVPDLRALSGGRELKAIPWHFKRIKLDPKVNVRVARGWIWKNLDGRFAFSLHRGESHYLIGFEDTSEASAFLLSQPLIVDESEKEYYQSQLNWL